MRKKEGHEVRKGQRIETMAANELKEKGFMIWKTIRVRYQNLDLFGLFDVAALAPDGSKLLLIQVKSNRVDNEMRDRIRALKVPAGVEKWIWIWRDRRGWIREFYE